MTKLHGVIPVLPTPFSDDEIVDYNSLERLIEHLVKTGVNGIAVFGVNSEFYKLAEAECRRIVPLMVEVVDHRVHTVVSVTRHATELAVRDARWAEDQGVDALMLLPPFFGRPSQEHLLNHMRKVIDAVDIPVIIQYAPDDTGGPEITSDTFMSLLDSVGKSFYVKVEVAPPGRLISALVKQSNGQIDVLIGSGGRFLYDALLRGAVGVMPGAATTKTYVEILQAFKQGSHEKAFRLYNVLVPFLNTVGIDAERYIYFDKRLLKQKGIISSSTMRQPCYEPDTGDMKLFGQYCRALGYFNETNGYHDRTCTSLS